LLFKEADGAQKALAVLESGDPAQYQNAKKLPATGLGDAGYGLQGDLTSMGFEVIKYIWRVNNVIICVHYNVQPGTIKPEDVLTTAVKVQEHTR
jgi:hypothetical protein